MSAAVDPAEAAVGLNGATATGSARQHGDTRYQPVLLPSPVLLTNTETGGAPRHLPIKVGEGRIMGAAPYMPWKSSSLF